VSREAHAGICESRGVRLPPATRPSSAGLRGQALNHPVLRWLKTVVVSDREKARQTRQIGTRKTFQSAQGRHYPSQGVVVDAS
jgi:hypothetical protein